MYYLCLAAFLLTLQYRSYSFMSTVYQWRISTMGKTLVFGVKPLIFPLSMIGAKAQMVQASAGVEQGQSRTKLGLLEYNVMQQ